MLQLEPGTHHRQQACPCMPGCEILICKPAAVDTDTARAVSLEKISALDAKLLDDAMEWSSFIALWIPAFSANKFRGVTIPTGMEITGLLAQSASMHSSAFAQLRR
jgi:hypothetical protein